MPTNPKKISGGYYIKARCIQESDISNAPPHVREIWDWFIMKANHKDYKNIKRGELLTSYNDILEGLCWYVGYRKCRYTKAQCETATKYLTRHEMITTKRTTRGMIVTVLNYDRFQNHRNYENHKEECNEPTREPQWHDTINKNVKEIIIHSSSADEVLVDGVDYLLTKKKRKLNGKRFKSFCQFWDIFNYKKGKRAAADSWYDIPELTNGLVEQILKAAKIEAENRKKIILSGGTPKMAQGWISDYRWEDETENDVGLKQSTPGWF